MNPEFFDDELFSHYSNRWRAILANVLQASDASIDKWLSSDEVFSERASGWMSHENESYKPSFLIVPDSARTIVGADRYLELVHAIDRLLHHAGVDVEDPSFGWTNIIESIDLLLRSAGISLDVSRKAWISQWG
jgi:hypothetical protein